MDYSVSFTRLMMSCQYSCSPQKPSELMITKSNRFTNREIRGAALLKIHHATAKIIASLNTESSEMRDVCEEDPNYFVNQSLADFEVVINLSTPLIAAVVKNAENGKPLLTSSSDLGLIGPLYYICISCPDSALREKAMELLLSCPR
ncbi:uncharacterized protein RAG0_07503 [Rhynchosporium agropyri]|uniref:Uncharacterized protein n=1 Tax=Rhynchosporium agropyri TaxID=914238 RepID=A0A1E1KLT3_9HELO|nr:uncharacterized protein RAG0_07503 [Rhynchosporium agropyri]